MATSPLVGIREVSEILRVSQRSLYQIRQAPWFIIRAIEAKAEQSREA